MTQIDHVRLLGIEIGVIDNGGAVAQILKWGRERPAKVVVTVNLDHIVKLRTDETFQAAYAAADLILADGMPLVWLARLEGTPLPERVAGSELIVPICQAAAKEGLSVYFLGTSEPILQAAADNLTARFPGLTIAGSHAPAFGFRNNDAAQRQAADMVAKSGADILFLAFGAPTQEIFATRFREELGCGAVVCIGAGLDFIAGEVARAPVWMQKSGTEWIWRTLQEPRRLGPRYARILWLLPSLISTHRADRRSRDDGAR